MRTLHIIRVILLAATFVGTLRLGVEFFAGWLVGVLFAVVYIAIMERESVQRLRERREEKR